MADELSVPISAISDVGAVAGAARSALDLATGILNRIDRDALVKDLNEDTIKIQNSFASNNLDDQWKCSYQLLNDVGHSLTPGGSVGDTERQFRHHALLSIAELKYAKAIIARLIAKRTQE